jgi:hypothetical protein
MSVSAALAEEVRPARRPAGERRATAPGACVQAGGCKSPGPDEFTRVIANPAQTRGIGDHEDDDQTQIGLGWHPAPAPGVFPPSPAPPAPVPASDNCHVRSGPSYTPTGRIPTTISGGRKRAKFSMAAAFSTDASRLRRPRCCSVRQFIKWDKAYQDWKGGPPHSGFAGLGHGVWHEDRDTADTRYGHRSGPHSAPIANCGDEYLTGGVRDQANGDTYCGRDEPAVLAVRNGVAATGTWQFQLKVIDTCNADAVRASSSVITIDWSR